METGMVPRLQGLSPLSVQHVVAAAQALDAGRADEAGRHLADALALNPDHPEVLRLHAGILSLRGEHAQAIRAMQRAAAQRPQDALYHNTMGTTLAAAGEFDAAVAALRQACTLQPDLAIGWYNLGVMLIRSVRFDEAADALKRAVALAPDHMLARTQLADMLRVGGCAGEAAAEYRKVLAERPWVGMAWWGLADLRTSQLGTDDIERMHAALRDPRASDDDRTATGYALASALDAAGRYAEALAALAQAKEIALRRQPWQASAFSAAVAAIDAAFTPPPDTASTADLGREAIFIVSLPRSGSTLVEQILASHSQVEGAGELPDLPLVIAEESHRRRMPFPHWVGAMQSADWERLGRRYLERTAHWRDRRPVFTDKLPNNWIYIGAIRAMLPGAHIVACHRDRLETCFSCYRQHLAGNEYSRTFPDLASYWRDFDRSTRHWAEQHPSNVRLHIYEELIADPPGCIRALLEFCGLPFEEACVRFHETKRDVRSPSATQVRQPLRADTARTPRYGALLDPLRAALDLPPFRA
ncbi:MAG: sulfotransferase [Xanthomonadaceae bacterium]|nr:sulfotransferase [Xanthomonadaceae bacterium]